MVEKISKFKQQLLFVIILEIVAAFLIYGFISSQATLVYALFILVSNSILGLFSYRIFRQLEASGVQIEKTLGEEYKNALLFGQLGLATYDEDYIINWQSDLLSSLHIDLVGTHLKEINPLLVDSPKSTKLIDYQQNDYYFEIFNLKQSRILFIRDTTNFTNLLEEYNHNQMVFGYLSVDNFDEATSAIDSQKGALVQSAIRFALIEWAKNNDIYLKRYRQENYIFVCNELTYENLVKENFSILEKVHKIAQDHDIYLALSIGIGRKDATMKGLDDLANDAINLAVSRGGDQVVVKSKDDKIRYFGGMHEAKTSANRVKAKSAYLGLQTKIKEASMIFIMGHNESDMDSLGASIACSYLISRTDIPTYIVVNPDSMEAKTKGAYRQLCKQGTFDDKFVLPSKVSELCKPGALLILVDNNRQSMTIAPHLVDMVKDAVVIDHHRRGEDFIKTATLTIIDSSASSTVEMILDFFDFLPKKAELTKLEANIMYSGIIVDTLNLKSKVSSRTFNMIAKLKNMNAEESEAYNMLRDDYTVAIKKAQLIQSANRYNSKVIISCAADDKEYDRALLAKVGNELLEINEIEAAFVIGRIDEDTVAVSARGKDNKFNVQVIMEEMGGGGHLGIAACQKKDMTCTEVKDQLVEILNSRLNLEEVE